MLCNTGEKISDQMPIWHPIGSKGFQLAYIKDELGLYFIAQSTSCSKGLHHSSFNQWWTSWQTQDEGWNNPAALTPSVYLERDLKQLIIIVCHQPPTWGKPEHCLPWTMKALHTKFCSFQKLCYSHEAHKMSWYLFGGFLQQQFTLMEVFQALLIKAKAGFYMTG